jgi:tol-pal system protein YbgF
MRHAVKFCTLATAISLQAFAPTVLAVEIQQRPLTKPQQQTATATAPAPVINPAINATPSPAINPAWDMFQQIEGLQNQVARLQGQLEEQQMLIERMQSDLRVRYEDLDQRIEALKSRTDSTATATHVKSTATSETGEFKNSVDYSSSPEQIEVQKEAYLAAYQEFRSKGANAAITAMQGFLKKHPNTVFSASAHYWLGEFKLALEPANLQSAEASFLKVIREFDGDSKVPAAYYKLGTVAELRGNMDEALRWMNDLIKRFPDSDEARLAKPFIEQNAPTVAP